jgi:hypothetical protein
VITNHGPGHGGVDSTGIDLVPALRRSTPPWSGCDSEFNEALDRGNFPPPVVLAHWEPEQMPRAAAVGDRVLQR